MRATVGSLDGRKATCRQEVADAMSVTVKENQFVRVARMTKILQSQQMVADSAEMSVADHQTWSNGAADVRYPYVVNKRETSLVDRRLRPAVGLCT
jgi:hypothetical protein